MIKPYVNLTKKDKLELGYVSDSGFCSIFNALNQVFIKNSLDLATLNVHYFWNKQKYKNYYLVSTPEFERESFDYVRAKEIGFNVGKNDIIKMSSNKGSTLKSIMLDNGAVTTTFSAKFLFSNFAKDVLELEEDHYQKTWFLIEKPKYDMWLSD